MASTIKVDKIEGSTGSTITVPTGQTLTVTDGIPVASGGTGLASFTQGDILYATGATTLVKLAKGTGRQGLQTNSGATAPEWTDSPQSLMTAAGDILYASGANTLAKLAKGSDDEVLTLASGVPSWAASAGGGKIGQVLQAVKTDKSTVTGATGTLADIPDLTISITPSASDSKILVMTDVLISATTGYAYNVTLVRDSTATIYIGDAASSRGRATKSGVNYHGASMKSASFCYLDSPATTSATTYKLQWWTETASTGAIGSSEGDGDTAYYSRVANSITVMEVLA